MLNKFKTLFLLLFFLSQASHASDSISHPLYVGITGGVGTTSWGYLVPQNISDALSTSIPIRVSEGGSVWGVMAGYDIIPEFSVEFSYMRYPTARLYFSPMSLFTFHHNGRTELTTRSEEVTFSGIFILPLPKAKIKAYSRVGAAGVHRADSILNAWRLSPTFGLGLYYDITPRWMAELGTEYTAGYGQSELEPADHYIPFLYSVFLRLAFRT